VGDDVHIHADWYESFDENFENYDLAIVDRQSGLIVVKPDLLVSGSSVVSSLFCQRKAGYAQWNYSPSPFTKSMQFFIIILILCHQY
jgi:hypothetical protein